MEFHKLTVAPPEKNDISILIVDDDNTMRRAYENFLTQAAYRVETAASGKEALEKLGAYTPDIALLDVMLPDMNGHDILDHIRGDNRLQKMFVIMVTGLMTTDANKTRGLESGADDYLEKPVSLAVIMARVRSMERRILSRRSLIETNRALEQIVAERTAALKKSNTSLQMEIKQHEKTLNILRHNAEWLRNLFKEAPVAGGTVSPDGKFMQVNNEMCRMTGYSEEELLRMGPAEITFADDHVRFRGIIKQLPNEEIPYFKEEKRYLKKDGSIFWGKETVRIITNPDGSKYFLPLIIDIDQQKKAKDALERAHTTLEWRISQRTDQLEAANQELRDEIQEKIKAQNDLLKKEKHLKTEEGIAALGSFFAPPDCTSLECSEGFFRLFGYHPGQVSTDFTFILNHIHSSDLDRFKRDIKQFSRRFIPLDEEYRVVTQKGSIREFRLIMNMLFNAERHPLEIQGIFQDVTNRKAMERQVIQNEKLASLGFLASGVAHEINNPNNLISFNIPILREYLKAVFPIIDDFAQRNSGLEFCHMSYPEFRKDLMKLTDNIETGSERINNIVSKFRNFAHMKQDMEHRSVDIGAQIKSCIDMAEIKLKRLVRRFDLIIPEDLPRVTTDPEILKIVVTNLLINAVQACDKEDSHVCLSVAYKTFVRPKLIIQVMDNGCGMDEETVSRAFDPFFSTKPSDQGTGIGLSLCHNLVSSLAGKIEVESRPGTGSTFKVTLPDMKRFDRNK